ncbi:MAG: heavy metal translocating P-type ATPase [Caldilineaceae bacterium]
MIQPFQRKRPRLIDALTQQAPRMPLAEQTEMPISNMQERKPSNFLTKAHRQQIVDILTFTQGSQKSAAEQRADRLLAFGLSSFGLLTVGRLIFAPLAGVGSLITLYLIAEIFRYAITSLWKQRRLTADILDVLLTVGVTASGYFTIAAIGISLNAFARKLMARTEDITHKRLVNIFSDQPQSVWVLADGVEVEVPFERITTGDILLVHSGQTIPVDGTIVAGTAAIDQHMLTGESQLVERGIGEGVFASTIVISGKIQIRVEKTGQATIAAQIGQVLNQTTAFKELIVARSLRITDAATLPTLALGALAWPVAGLSGGLAVLACSAGYNLRLTGPISMLNFLQSFSQQGILVKDGRSLELLNTVDTVVFDKTGTLTIETLQLAAIHTLNGWSTDEILAHAAATEHRQSHPIAQAIRAAAAERQLSLPAIDTLHYEVGFGIQATMQDGALVQVGSERYLRQLQIPLSATAETIQAQSQSCGHSLVFVAVDAQCVGAIELQPTVREEVEAVIAALRSRNLAPYILSGDQEAPTKQLAERLGMDRYFANTLPQDKAQIIADLQAAGRSVCFVGDGINDSIALKKANVSISLRGATTVATDTAQIVLMDGTLEKLPLLFSVSQQFHTTMQRNVTLSIIPAVFCVAGVFVLHWGLLSAFLIYNLGLLTGLLNSSQPLAMITADDDNTHSNGTDNNNSALNHERLLDVKHA